MSGTKQPLRPLILKLMRQQTSLLADEALLSALKDMPVSELSGTAYTKIRAEFKTAFAKKLTEGDWEG
jgi:hypothetical protein